MSIEFWVGAVVTVAIAGGIYWAMRRQRNRRAPPSGPTNEHDERRNGGRIP